jgi:Flp pilus assembly protein TadD
MKHLVVLLVAAGAVWAQSDAPAQPKPDLAAERQQAIALFNKGQAPAALLLLEDLVAANPNDGDTQGLLAYCLFVTARWRLTTRP